MQPLSEFIHTYPVPLPAPSTPPSISLLGDAEPPERSRSLGSDRLERCEPLEPLERFERRDKFKRREKSQD